MLVDKDVVIVETYQAGQKKDVAVFIAERKKLSLRAKLYCRNRAYMLYPQCFVLLFEL